MSTSQLPTDLSSSDLPKWAHLRVVSKFFEAVTDGGGRHLSQGDGERLASVFYEAAEGKYSALVTNVHPMARRVAIREAIKQCSPGPKNGVLIVFPGYPAMEVSRMELQSDSGTTLVAGRHLQVIRTSYSFGSDIDIGLVTINILTGMLARNEHAPLSQFGTVIFADLQSATSSGLLALRKLVRAMRSVRPGCSFIGLTDSVGNPERLSEVVFGGMRVETTDLELPTYPDLFQATPVWTDELMVERAARIAAAMVQDGLRPLIHAPSPWLVTELRRSCETALSELGLSAPVLGLSRLEKDDDWNQLRALAQGKYAAAITPQSFETDFVWPCTALVVCGLPPSCSRFRGSLSRFSGKVGVWIPDLRQPQDMMFQSNPAALLESSAIVLCDESPREEARFQLSIDEKFLGLFGRERPVRSLPADEARRKYYQGALVTEGGKRYQVDRFEERERKIVLRSIPPSDRVTTAVELVGVEVQSEQDMTTIVGPYELKVCGLQTSTAIHTFKEFTRDRVPVCQVRNCSAPQPNRSNCSECGGPLRSMVVERNVSYLPTGPISISTQVQAVRISPIGPGGEPEWKLLHSIEHAFRLATQFVLGLPQSKLRGLAWQNGACFVWTIDDSKEFCRLFLENFEAIQSVVATILTHCGCLPDEGCTSCLKAPSCECDHAGVSKAAIFEWVRRASVFHPTDNVQASDLEGSESHVPHLDGLDCPPEDRSGAGESDSANGQGVVEGPILGSSEGPRTPHATGNVPTRSPLWAPLKLRALHFEDRRVNGRLPRTGTGPISVDGHVVDEPDDEFVWAADTEDGTESDGPPNFTVDGPSAWPAPSENAPVVAGERSSAAVLALARELSLQSGTYSRANFEEGEILSPIFKRYPLLNHYDHLRLARLYDRGNNEAKVLMTVHNLRLVAKMANRYRSTNLDFMDLFQEGTIGLMRAVDKWDPTRGNQFSTYATHWIKQSITRYVDDCDRLIRIPVHMKEQLRVLRKAIERLTRESGKEPSNLELAKELDSAPERISELRKLLRNYQIASLDGWGDDDDERTPLGETLEAPFEAQLMNWAEELEMRRQVHRMLSELLTVKEREVLRLRFGFDGHVHTLEEIGHQYGVTRERIRQIESKAVLKIRKSINRKGSAYGHLLDWLE